MCVSRPNSNAPLTSTPRDPAALSVGGRGQRADRTDGTSVTIGLERIQINRRRRYAREVSRDSLRIDVVIQPHVETVDGKIARLAAIPFVADVQLLGAPRLKLGIASLRRPGVNHHTRPARLVRRHNDLCRPTRRSQEPGSRACRPCVVAPSPWPRRSECGCADPGRRRGSRLGRTSVYLAPSLT